jgi:branched-chain amino acid transport system permease protein
MLFLYRTRTGLAARAVAQHKENAGLMGVNVKRISSLVYAMYAGLTAMSGVLIGGIYSITAQDGPQYTLLDFFVVVLAGLGSIGGVLVAGLLLGILQALVTVYVSADYTLAIVFGVLFLTLVISPRGLLRRGTA